MDKIGPAKLSTVFLIGTLLVFLLSLMLLSGCVQNGIYHEVRPGQTLYRISKTYNVDEAYLARINGIPNPTQLRVGTRVYIPGAEQKKYVPSTVPGYSASGSKQTASKPKSNSKPAVSRPATTKSSTAKLTRKSSSRKPGKVSIKLNWPVRGKILRTFGESGKGGGKGIEISAREGTQVKAAAAGKVIYSGDGVQGFGHLLIIQHEGDVFTVYGFNDRNLARQGQFVSKGQKVASSGRPPSGGSGRLHFEVRVGKVAVNPILYLP